MSASEKSEQNAFHRTGPYVVPDYPDMTWTDAVDEEEGEDLADLGVPDVLPAPWAEKARAAASAARGAGDAAWSAVRADKAVTAAAVAGAVTALGLAYLVGRRAGRRAARSSLGPMALLLERRG
ncbi:hypothetical protein ACFWIN_30670 [Streptomyces sp. NPDC127049]|uniref:hypothetical protein n=1 Tax=Streptomyces sp. NPDC127049 TaxID=3347118 RepID=UPI0036495681